MKKLSVKKEILLVIMIIAIIFAISTSVFASTANPIVVPGLNDGGTPSTQTPETPEEDEKPATQIPTTPTTPTTPTQDGNEVGSTYQNTALPQTGDASDYAIFLVIVVAAVVAVFAYKKVREYNI